MIRKIYYAFVGPARIIIGAVTWFAVAYLDIAFVLSKIWTSQAENMIVVPFEPLVIANLTFVLMYITLKE